MKLKTNDKNFLIALNSLFTIIAVIGYILGEYQIYRFFPVISIINIIVLLKTKN